MDVTKSDISYADIELLVLIYKKTVNYERYVTIETVYKLFRNEWIEETISYLFTNKHAFEIEDAEFEAIDERLESYGFRVPSYEDIHKLFDIIQLVYWTSTGDAIHSAVMSVW